MSELRANRGASELPYQLLVSQCPVPCPLDRGLLGQPSLQKRGDAGPCSLRERKCAVCSGSSRVPWGSSRRRQGPLSPPLLAHSFFKLLAEGFGLPLQVVLGWCRWLGPELGKAWVCLSEIGGGVLGLAQPGAWHAPLEPYLESVYLFIYLFGRVASFHSPCVPSPLQSVFFTLPVQAAQVLASWPPSHRPSSLSISCVATLAPLGPWSQVL